MTTWETYLEENRQRFLDELLDFLSIPSISALPEHKHDVALGRSEVIVRTTIVKSSNLGRADQTRMMGIKRMELVGCDPDCDECQAVISGNPYNADEVEGIEMGLHPNHTGSWVPIVTDADLEQELQQAVASEQIENWKEKYLDARKTAFAHEKAPSEGIPTHLPIGPDWKAYSRARGYTKSEIDQYQKLIDLVNQGERLGLSRDEITALGQTVISKGYIGK